ncbi:MAG: DUF3524 domain-containing protein [Planctomycetia bacterium]|nr:DUF3524 domain-containing protein [Planctomycetia bacterium]
MARLNILAVEPYFSGPRREFLEGLRSHSRHVWTLLTLPARNRQWRLQGSALHFADQMKRLRRQRFDVLLVTDMVNLCELVAIARPRLAHLPAVVYFHENALPPAGGQRRGSRPATRGTQGFSQITTALAATQVWFNSKYHREEFLLSAEATLRHAPDYVPAGLVESIRKRSRVVPPGTDMQPFVAGRKRKRPGSGPLTILWNHRWENDKNPEEFFDLMFFLADEGHAYRLAVVGETLRKWPPVFEKARRKLGSRMVQFGYLPDKHDYVRTVQESDVVISTAIHEFFGLPVVEAIASGLYPLLPNRLSYTEIIPARWHGEFLYRDSRGLRSRLIRLLEGKADWAPARQLASHIQAHDWHNLAKRYDEALEELASRRLD